MDDSQLLSMFDGKNVLITGGTGSLGQALTSKLLKSKVNQIRIFSRNELKQIEMEEKFDDSTAILMDFRCDQSKGIHFIYFLPFSKNLVCLGL